MTLQEKYDIILTHNSDLVKDVEFLRDIRVRLEVSRNTLATRLLAAETTILELKKENESLTQTLARWK